MNYSKLFPLREVKHDKRIRQSEKYVVNRSRTKRHRASAVPYLQGLLNKDHYKRRKELESLLVAGSSQRKFSGQPKISFCNATIARTDILLILESISITVFMTSISHTIIVIVALIQIGHKWTVVLTIVN